MRPKKRVLLIDSNEVGQSVTRFLLATKGFLVLSASTPSEALDVLAVDQVDCILLRDRGRTLETLEFWKALASAAQARPGSSESIPILFLSASTEDRIDDPCYSFKLSERSPAEALIFRLRVLSSSKRGPAKKPVSSVPSLDLLRRFA